MARKLIRCEICGKEFSYKRSRQLKENYHKYCSRECSNIGKGRTNSKNHPNQSKIRSQQAKIYRDTRIRYDGYAIFVNGKYPCIKVNGKRVHLHRYVWMKYNGPIPKGYVIHHRDENHWNYDISNLECLSRKEHYLRHKEKIDISKIGKPYRKKRLERFGK